MAGVEDAALSLWSAELALVSARPNALRLLRPTCYRHYFNCDEREGLALSSESKSPFHPPTLFIALMLVSFMGAVFAICFLWKDFLAALARLS